MYLFITIYIYIILDYNNNYHHSFSKNKIYKYINKYVKYIKI